MRTLLVMLIFFQAPSAYCQTSVIHWNKNDRIEWSDFTGKADTKSQYAAMSAVGISYKYNAWGNGKGYKIDFVIYSTFDKSKSWSKINLRSANMLRHEQLHFDIGELVSRAFRKEAENKTYSKNYREEIAGLFKKYADILQRFQEKYDWQTLHGNDKEKQKEWESVVHRELLQ